MPSDAPPTDRLRVAIDATPMLGVRTGVGHVTAGFVDELAARAEVQLLAYAVTRAPSARLAEDLPTGVTAHSTRIPARAVFSMWTRTARPRVERFTGPVDVVHATNFVAPPARAPVLLTIHDLTFVRYPEMCTPGTLRYDGLVRRAIERGATIHVVSDFVGAEVREVFDLPPGRVRRIYAGLAPTAGGDALVGRRIASSQKYVLALGTLEPRKNLPTLVRAFDRIARYDSDLVLALGGPDGWGVDEINAAVAQAAHGSRVHRLGYVTDDDRRDLLAGASVVAYPSHYEGFGHTPLEAMAAGVPVVAAAAGSLPEVLGDAALLVDPNDEVALATELARVIDDAAVRATLVERGHERVRLYTWDRAVDEMTALYRELAASA